MELKGAFYMKSIKRQYSYQLLRIGVVIDKPYTGGMKGRDS